LLTRRKAGAPNEQIEVESQLGNENIRVAVIFVSAHDESEARALAIENSAIAFFGKPFSAESLLEKICSALNN
jgi:FixJ family two-component response regulator